MSETINVIDAEEINRQIVQRLKTLLVIQHKIARLEQMREHQQKEIDRLIKRV